MAVDRQDDQAGSIEGWSEEQQTAVQRRTLGVLFASAIFGRAAMSMGFAVAALIIKEMLGDGTWAGSSTAAVTVGTAFSASILSSYMYSRGRRPGLSVGYVAATVGAAIAVFAGQNLLLVVFLIGIVFIGVGQGATNLARYAAADLAKPENRGKAISSVVFASTVGAVGGPALVGPAGRVAESLGLDELVGGYLFSTVSFAIAGLILWVGLRPDPLVVAGGLRQQTTTKQRGDFSSGFSAIRENPLARLAALGLALSQLVMVMVMAMTPLHMDAHGHSLGTIGWVISAHTRRHVPPSPRSAAGPPTASGESQPLALGGGTLVAATAMTALAGEAPALLMFPGLFLLGLGWSFGIVASSALLTESVPGEQQVQAQGAADFVTSFASGAGALASGFVFTMAGFHILSMLGIAAAGIMLVACFYRFRAVALAT